MESKFEQLQRALIEVDKLTGAKTKCEVDIFQDTFTIEVTGPDGTPAEDTFYIKHGYMTEYLDVRLRKAQLVITMADATPNPDLLATFAQKHSLLSIEGAKLYRQE